MTPLHVAAQRGDRISIVKYFLHQKADINIKDGNKVSQTTLVYGTVIQEWY